ncbi:MAG: hypothetical protein A2Y14_05945 [Verrucomicrobia bacterium GWF2_51_19]|nr:MAG: hypothetical protein A2Y14_05945 [Verrucomicrobia bacterium GWF2_51_19]HCJ12115.1 hypothetical protein [Opitutae bacterium]
MKIGDFSKIPQSSEGIKKVKEKGIATPLKTVITGKPLTARKSKWIKATAWVKNATRQVFSKASKDEATLIQKLSKNAERFVEKLLSRDSHFLSEIASITKNLQSKELKKLTLHGIDFNKLKDKDLLSALQTFAQGKCSLDTLALDLSKRAGNAIEASDTVIFLDAVLDQAIQRMGKDDTLNQSLKKALPKLAQALFEREKEHGTFLESYFSGIASQDSETLVQLIQQASDTRGIDSEVLFALFASIQKETGVVVESGAVYIDPDKENRAQSVDLKNALENDLDLLKAYKRLTSTELRHRFRCVSPRKVLGKGAVNAVALVKVVGSNGKVEERVWKSDALSRAYSFQRALTGLKEFLGGTAKQSGIDVLEHSYYPERSVATAKIDAWLFGDKGVCVSTEIAHLGQEHGILMDKAAGRPLEVKQAETLTQELTLDAGFLRSIKNDEQTLVDLAFWHGARKAEWVDRAKGIYRIHAFASNLPPDNVSSCDGLVRTQLLDYLSGQSDRHPENYFNGEDGRIFAIDNDCSFGLNVVDEKGHVRVDNKSAIHASLLVDMPVVITREHQEAVLNLWNNPQRLEELTQLINPEEYAQTLHRLECLAKHVQDPKRCKIVETPQELLEDYKRSLNDSKSAITTNNSYWKRDLLLAKGHGLGKWGFLREKRAF